MIVKKAGSSSLMVLIFFKISPVFAITAHVYVDSIAISSLANLACTDLSSLTVNFYSINSEVTNISRPVTVDCFSNNKQSVIVVSEVQSILDIPGIQCEKSLAVDVTLQFSDGSLFTLHRLWNRGSDAFSDQRRIATDVSQSSPSQSTTSSSTSLTTSQANNRYVTFHWGLVIDDGTCDGVASKSCVAEYIVIGIESSVLIVILIIGLYFFVKSRGGCDCPSVSFNLRKSRVAPPTQVTREDPMWENDDYRTHRAGGGAIGMTSFSDPQPSHMVTTPVRSSALSPPTNNGPNTTGKQRQPGLLDRKKANKTAPEPPPKDFPQDTTYDTIADDMSRQQQHRQQPPKLVVPADDWDEQEYEDVDDENRFNGTYNDADDPSRRRRH